MAVVDLADVRDPIRGSLAARGTFEPSYARLARLRAYFIDRSQAMVENQFTTTLSVSREELYELAVAADQALARIEAAR
jgi:hypothetical protein